MIVKMIILRLLGSSDDKEKEKIGVARTEGPPLKALRSAALEEPTHEHRCIRWLSEEPTPWQKGIKAKSAYRHRMNRWIKKGVSVHWAYYVPETMSSAQDKILQHRLNR